MRAVKIIGWVLVGIMLLLAVAVTATIGWRPFIGPRTRALSDRHYESSPQRLARGRYLTENLLNCFGCHSEREWTQHDVPEIPGSRGGGNPHFPLEDLPGKVSPPNISPDPETGAGRWTDDQLARAIREGIGFDGRALFPFMPYENYRYLSDEDLASVIVYLRSIPPVRKSVPPTELVFPVKYLIRSAPQPVTEPVPDPGLSAPARRGAYLATIGGCHDCHTPLRDGQRLEHLALAGGFPVNGPWGRVASTNLTPDPSGIPYYDEGLFIEVMRTGWVKARKLNQIMPWWNFRYLDDVDLQGIFAHLRTLEPIKHRVDNSLPETPCPLCGFAHGAGEQN